MTAMTASAASAAAAIAAGLRTPPGPDDPWRAQSLADGAAGTALLHVERARAGTGGWDTAHAWLAAATAGVVSAADHAGLLFGAPAVAFAAHTAADPPERYARARQRLDTAVEALTHRRVDLAHARIDRNELASFAEYDLLRGLTGIGAHLLRHAPGSDALGRILTYLVRLATHPLRVEGTTLPGWWVGHPPHRDATADLRAGHGNLGIAHGIAGPLALLAHALRRGITVDGHTTAITAFCQHLDTWQEENAGGACWPQWITRDQLHTRRPTGAGPARPSWCYGTPGIARAQQLAALATGDPARQAMAEHALTACLADPAQLEHILDTSLCHGWAGLYQTVWRAAHDAATPDLPAALPALTDLLLRDAQPGRGEGTGLLEGDAGLALALHTAAHGAPVSGWDAFLLLA